MAIICPLFEIYILCFFARAILSWFPPPREGFLATANSFLFTITEPLLRPVRRLVPPMGAIDVSFLLVMVGLFVIRQIVCG
jgi:YggT family protein